MKYKLLVVFFAFFNFDFFLFSQEKLFNNILNNVERNIDKNYYTDSIVAVRHSEYIFNELTEDFEKVVYIEYFPTPIWSMDEKYYNQKFGFNNSIFPSRIYGYLIMAKMYKKDESKHLGFTIPHRFASHFTFIDINLFNSSISMFVRNNREKRRENSNNNNDTNLPNKINIPSFNTNDKQGNQEPKISIEYGSDNNKKTNKNNATSADKLPKTITITGTPIYTIISDSATYKVDNIVYNGTDCYKLTKIITKHFMYKEFERQRLENTMINEPVSLLEQKYMTEQQKEEFRQIVEYWANGGGFFSQTYIVEKKNFAVLSFLQEIKRQNNKGEWIDIEKTMEKYQEGKNKKYYQTSFTKLIRNYNGGSPNINNILTLVVRTPINKSFSLDSTTVLPRRMLDLTYEDFCTKVDTIDDDMLLDWNKYNE